LPGCYIGRNPKKGIESLRLLHHSPRRDSTSIVIQVRTPEVEKQFEVVSKDPTSSSKERGVKTAER
jgi:hypothetical protein